MIGNWMKPSIICYIILPLVAWGIIKDAANTINGGSVDLRNRVTGARVAAFGKDPYMYKWMPGEPTVFCDLYNEPGALLSKTTVTPWALAGHAPFNSLNYRSIQWLWFFIQYGVLIGGVWLWSRCHRDLGVAGWGLILALLFSLTPSWRHHVDHGQIYAVYAGLFLVLYWLNQQQSKNNLFAIGEGLLGGFALGSRPIYFGQFTEPLREKRWLTLIAGGFGLVLVFVVPIVVFGSSIWSQYRSAMETHAELYLNQMKPGRVPLAYPNFIENIPIDIIGGLNRAIPFADTSIYKLVSLSLPAKGLLICWLAAMSAGMIYLVKLKASRELIWWSVIAWIVIADFLLPAFRHTYNDVIALPLFLFGLSAITKHTPKDKFTWVITCAAILVSMILTWQLNSKWVLPLPSTTLLLLGMASIAWSISLARNKRVKSGR